eukprot:5635935-Amphidinium_carterae.3
MVLRMEYASSKVIIRNPSICPLVACGCKPRRSLESCGVCMLAGTRVAPHSFAKLYSSRLHIVYRIGPASPPYHKRSTYGV